MVLRLMQFIGQSRGFAFAQFVGINEARRFLDQYYPTVQLYGPHHIDPNATSDPMNVRIAYSRDRDDRDKAGKGEDDWKCEVVCRYVLLVLQVLIGFSATFPIFPIELCVFAVTLRELVCPPDISIVVTNEHRSDRTRRCSCPD